MTIRVVLYYGLTLMALFATLGWLHWVSDFQMRGGGQALCEKSRGPAVETEMTHKDYDMSELKKLLKSFSVGAAMTVTIHAYMAVVPALLLQIVGQVRLHSQLHYMTMPSSQYTF
ncbi:hypothetical protein BDL97_09G068900 [Sphagnum fallax]|nr:hypothetical protein BDL97_09G068900 [Sphagnum fallax]